MINIDEKNYSLQNTKGELRDGIELPENELGDIIIIHFSSTEVVEGNSEVLLTVMNVGLQSFIVDSRISQ